MLTSRDAIKDRVKGPEAGADGDLIKPFAFDELFARVRALLRRASASTVTNTNAETLQFADITIDLRGRTALRGTRPLRLTTREFDLLVLFLRHPNQVLSRGQIMARIWGEDFYGDSNVLEVFVGNLRRELEMDDASRVIQTIRGAGYVLREEYWDDRRATLDRVDPISPGGLVCGDCLPRHPRVGCQLFDLAGA